MAPFGVVSLSTCHVDHPLLLVCYLGRHRFCPSEPAGSYPPFFARFCPVRIFRLGILKTHHLLELVHPGIENDQCQVGRRRMKTVALHALGKPLQLLSARPLHRNLRLHVRTIETRTPSR